jgi:hypothetical protein
MVHFQTTIYDNTTGLNAYFQKGFFDHEEKKGFEAMIICKRERVFKGRNCCFVNVLQLFVLSVANVQVQDIGLLCVFLWGVLFI